jgi:hypothetical protein
LFALLHRATPARIAVVLAAVALPLADILLRGRRGELVTLGLVLLLTLYFRRLWAPRVRTLMAAMLLGAVVVVVAPDYRQHSQLGADHGELLRIEVLGAVSDIVTGREPTELVYAAVQLPATLRADEYGWGRGLYNRFVQDAIPSLLVGREVKVSLFVPAPDFLLHTLRYYNWQAPVGWIPTAPTDVFRVAGFLGPLLFAGFGALFRLLWLRTGSSVGAQALYIVVAPMAMQSVTVGVSHLVAPMFFTVVFMLPALLWAQRPLGEDMDHRSADGGRHADWPRAV